VFSQDRINFHQNPGRGTAFEGAVCGGVWVLTPPGQAEQDIPYHVLSCWVPVGRSWAVGTHSWLGSAQLWSSLGGRLSVLCGFVLCFLLICIVVVTVPFVCCSVKLPLSRPTGFCPFLSHLLCTLVWGGEATWRFLLPAAAKP